MVLRLPRRLRDPFTALLLFGAAGIVAMILAFVVTSLPRLGGPAAPAAGGPRQAVASPSPSPTAPPRPSPAEPKHKGHGHGGEGGG